MGGTSTDSFGGSALQPFIGDDRALVPATTNFSAGVGNADFEKKEPAFATSVACGCYNFCARRRGRGVTYIDCDADRQLTWSKQWLEHAPRGDLHQRYHASRSQHWWKLVSSLT